MKDKMDKSFSYKVGDIDEVVDSKGNSVILLRKLAWGENGKEKLELRKWVIDIAKETPLKGVTFLTEEGPHNLVTVLLQKGYGHTKNILETISLRNDFKDSLESLGKPSKAKSSNKYIDPKDILS